MGYIWKTSHMTIHFSIIGNWVIFSPQADVGLNMLSGAGRGGGAEGR